MLQAAIVLNNSDTYNTICAISEQVAEKYLKAFLVEHNISFPYIHTMTNLVGLCTPIDPGFASLYNKLATLDQFYKRFHYFSGVSATQAQAQLAIQLAADIRAYVRNLLGI